MESILQTLEHNIVKRGGGGWARGDKGGRDGGQAAPALQPAALTAHDVCAQQCHSQIVLDACIGHYTPYSPQL